MWKWPSEVIEAVYNKTVIFHNMVKISSFLCLAIV